MPIDIEGLLKPISSEQPGGADLRYAPVTAEIREARRQEDDVAQGVWKRQLKSADYAQVQKRCVQVLTKQSKDLQTAAWLTEALLARDGFPGLLQGLQLVRRLLEDFWESVHPQIEDGGDLEMRATPLRWIGFQLDPLIRSSPLTERGYGWLRYKESRTVPPEEEANVNSDKNRTRTELLAEGRLAPEEFERAFQDSSAQFYEKLSNDLTNAVEYVRELSAFCDEKFTDEPPDFNPLIKGLEEVYQTVHILHLKKAGNGGAKPAAAAPQQTTAAPAPASVAYQDPYGDPPLYFPDPSAPAPPGPAVQATGFPAAATAARPARIVSSGPEPADPAEAFDRIAVAAHYLRRQNPNNPSPYLVLRGLRWGEIRAGGSYPDPLLAEAPPSETRVLLKRLVNEINWDQVIEAGESAMAQPCGRAWLDLQRYVARACRFSGYNEPANAIAAELRAFLQEYPQILDWTLSDDTPAANAETREWLREEKIVGGVTAPVKAEAPPPPSSTMWEPEPPPRGSANTTVEAPPDAYDLAVDAARSGRVNEAVGLLQAEMQAARSGRDRFVRKTQLVQVCLASGNEAIALPILRDLVAEIERRRLEEWEESELIAQPLHLLYGCLNRMGTNGAETQELYARLCRVDPARALVLPR